MSSAPDISLDDYKSSEDSDYAPDDLIGSKDEEVCSDDDSELDQIPGKVRAKRRKCSDGKHENLCIENSGDEKTLTEAKILRDSLKKNRSENSEQSLGNNEQIKTRSKRAQESKELEKPQTTGMSSAVIDVDAVWQAMISGKPLPRSSCGSMLHSNSPSESLLSTHDHEDVKRRQDVSQSLSLPRMPIDDKPESTIKIKYNYKFAGKVHSCEKTVPLNSAEAKLHLNTKLSDPTHAAVELCSSDSSIPPKRPIRLARRSIFEPLSDNITPRSDLRLGVRKQTNSKLESSLSQEKKLNTVEKSALDWASFVDEEGIGDELIAAGKSKDAYKARQEFLARVEQKKENESRRARGLPV